jgi:hypothetical protein
MYRGLHVKYLYFCQFLMKIKYSCQIFEKYSEYRIWLKSVQWEPSYSMRTDRQTDRQTDSQTGRHDVHVWFSNFVNVPKIKVIRFNPLSRCSINLPADLHCLSLKLSLALENTRIIFTLLSVGLRQAVEFRD